MSQTASSDLPTSGQLLRATALAVVVAAAILITIVLPAEFGIDPTGSGHALGLFRPAAADPAGSDALPASAMSTSGALMKVATPFRSDEMTITLKPGEGTEIKAAMRQGERFVFTWTATAELDTDMHGEAVSAKEGEYTSYWKDESQSSGHGAFEAPVTGRHGWFWQNLTFEPVTVTVKTSGFYEKLFRP